MASLAHNTPLYCRCCRNKKNLLNVHTVRIRKTSTTYVEMIAECVSSDLSNSDILPSWVCKKCSNKLNSFYKFKKMCFKTLDNVKQIKETIESVVEKDVNKNDVESKVLSIKMEGDEQEHLDVQTEDFNETIVFEELNTVSHNLVEEEKIKCDPTDLKYEIDVVNNFLYEDVYEDVKDSTCQNYEEIYEPNEVTDEKCQQEKELQIILPQISERQTQCPICSKHLRYNNALLDHIKYDHFGIKYFCEVCKKYFNNEYRHKRIHIKNKYPCDQCEEAFTNKPQFLQHIKQVHGQNGSFKCECGETFAKRREINAHRFLAHNKTAYTCYICEQGFLRKDHFQTHLRLHSQGRKVRKFRSKCRENKLQVNKKIVSPEEIPLVGEKETRCPICNIKCSYNKKLLEHIQMVHLGQKYYCKLCKKYYSSEIRHSLKHRTYSKCTECNTKFNNKKDYTDHMHSVHNVTQETCPHICHCGQKFQLLPQFRRHKYHAHKETDFICQFCSKGFLKKDRLKEHVQMHTKEDTFKCPICLSTFYNRSSLSKHKLRVHRTENVYVCDYCDKVFKSKPYLKSHITAHDPKNKPYACVVCGKRFRRSDHRNNHQELVHKLERLNNV